ncbi:Cystathionine gamma-synthase [Collariella sp. IMI 366227]|nr:Cystathionine gamma-synthase [Collariella sp. IMI 366227]
MPAFDIGESIPPHTAHAVSVSLPTWKSNIGYEEGEEWVVSRMASGYPRFFIHKSIQAFAADIVARFGTPGSKAFLFPTRQIAARGVCFVKGRAPPEIAASLDTISLVLDKTNPATESLKPLCPEIHAILISQDGFSFVKQYWQHTGDGVSSRRAEFCHSLLKDGLLRLDDGISTPLPASPKPHKGPKRYERPPRARRQRRPDIQESSRFLEERFGRNLDVSFVQPAKSAIKRRIAGALHSNSELTTTPARPRDGHQHPRRGQPPRGRHLPFPQRHVRHLQHAPRPLAARPSASSLKASTSGARLFLDLDALEARLQSGERFLALFCEFPNNPLTCPDLPRIRALADRFDFAVVVDETIGTFANVNVLPYADVVVSSLTKIFSGDANAICFTLTSPYVLLAHYGELEWAEQFGVERDLVRISVGLEETEHIVNVFKAALKVAEESTGGRE